MSYQDHRVMRRLHYEEQAYEAYRQVYDEVEAEQRSEWEAEFDTIPYRPNGAELHRLAMEKMESLTEGACM